MPDRTALTRAVATIDRLDWAPFTLDASGHVERAPDSIEYDAPSVYHDEDEDVMIDGRGPWEAMTGLTGQYGYHGAVMHPSETMSPGVVAAMLDAQDGEAWIWALVVVDVHDCIDIGDPCVAEAIAEGCPDEDARARGCSGGPGCDEWQGCPGHEPAGWVIVHRPA